jgi:hypothetical protein
MRVTTSKFKFRIGIRNQSGEKSQPRNLLPE